MKHIKLFEAYNKELAKDYAEHVTGVKVVDKVDEKLLQQAWEDFSKQFDDWAFDERDEPYQFETIVKKLIKRDLTDKEKKDSLYKEFDKRATELLNVADDVAHQARVGQRTGQGENKPYEKAWKKYNELKG